MSKSKPTLLPLTIENETQWVKRADYVKAVSGQFAIQFKAEVGRTHINQMLDAIEAGKTGLGDDNPAEFIAVFDKVLEDYEAGQEHDDELELEAQRVKQEEEDAAKEKEEAEQELFLSVKDESAGFADLAKMFDTGENMDRFTPKKGVKDADLFSAFNASLSMGEFTSWMKGDLVVELEKRGHIGVCTKIAEERGMKFSSLYRMAKTAKVVPPESRVKGVSFTIYAEIANAKLAEKPEDHETKLLALLEKASSGDLNTQTAREAVKEAQGKGPKPDVLPEDDAKRTFLVVQVDAEGGDEVKTVKGFPKLAYEDGAIIIDLKTGARFAENGFRKAAANRWVAVPEYKAPEPEPEPEKPAKKKGKK